MPQVELTHLAEQSIRTLGDVRARQLIATYNAMRHQQRWPSWFAADAHRRGARPPDVRVA